MCMTLHLLMLNLAAKCLITVANAVQVILECVAVIVMSLFCTRPSCHLQTFSCNIVSRITS